MTVTDILLNFRAALLSILPMVEKAGIAWRPDEAYDQWDDITECLFHQLVGEAVLLILDPEERLDIKFPRYGMIETSDDRLATIDVLHPSLGAGRWIFNGFATSGRPFDLVEVRAAGAPPVAAAMRTCSVEGAVFSLRMPDERKIEQLGS